MMNLLEYMRLSRREPTAKIAKERLQILVAHDRVQRNRPSYLPNLQREILEVISKYVDIDPNSVTVNLDQDDKREILELNIVLPENNSRS